jgi:hypothetical protein
VLSPDIRSLAAALGNSPAALYAHMYNYIRWIPYLMAMQNSEAVLWSGRGSDADHTSQGWPAASTATGGIQRCARLIWTTKTR